MIYFLSAQKECSQCLEDSVSWMNHSLTDHNYIPLRKGWNRFPKLHEPWENYRISFKDNKSVRLRRPDRISSCVNLDRAASELLVTMLIVTNRTVQSILDSGLRICYGRLKNWKPKSFKQAKRPNWQEYQKDLTEFGKSICWMTFYREINVVQRLPGIQIMAKYPTNPIGTLQWPLGG